MMPRPSTLGLAILSAALVTWLAAASSTGLRSSPPSVPDVREPSATVEVLFDDVARLHQRLEQTPALIRPARNPFRFAAAPRRGASPGGRSKSIEAAESAPAAQPAAAALSLVGMAEQPGVNGAAPERTAIVTSAGEVFLVKAGDPVGGQYRVSRIDADAIELARIGDASLVRLSLK